MPNIKSAIKRVKVIAKKNLRNRMVKSAMKTQLKKFETALAKEPAAAASLLPQSAGAVDRAASKGVIHKNAANRRKSRMALRLNKTVAKA
ncbi:MAG: 30S ribosomal protein S20 [Oscillospiraceae bacterium]|jgi:small subunit ribosomal protein S20|nr:30S ribosomal protein S20 [Oscillospiraceae bacterium]